MTARNKQQVARQFSRAAASYDKAAGIQQQVVTALLNDLPPLHGHWLDIGCGTGVALPHLRNRGAASVTGIDLSEGMLACAAAHADSQTQLVLADADDLPVADASADGIFSSLMLQWSEAPELTLAEWRRTLNNDGQLVLATLLPGTQRELEQAWQAIDSHRHVNDFVPLPRLEQLLRQAGFTQLSIRQACLQEQHPDLNQLLRTLKQIGATNVNPDRRQGLGGRRALQQLQHHYPTVCSDGQTVYPLSYEVAWITAKAGSVPA